MTDLQSTKDGIRASLRDLLSLHGAPGFEQGPVAYFQKRVNAIADTVETDRYGNVTAIRRGRHDHPRLMISAHLDEIGFIVKGIEPSGFLRFDRLGGTADALVLCRRVSVNGHFGVIGAKPGHLQSAEEQARKPDVYDMYIDVGASSADEVARMGIRVGDPVTFVGELAEFTGGDRVCGKAMDDRLGVAVLLQLLSEIQSTTPFGTLHAVGTVLEQVGLRGAMMAGLSHPARLRHRHRRALVGRHAGLEPHAGHRATHGRRSRRAARGVHGRVPGQHRAPRHEALPAAGGRARGRARAAGHASLARLDGSSVHPPRARGIPTISVGVPRRYSYSANEVIDLNDAARAVRMLARFVTDMEEHVDLGFL
jgi:endoglucanase